MKRYRNKKLPANNRHIQDEIYKANNMEHFSKEKIIFFKTISNQSHENPQRQVSSI